MIPTTRRLCWSTIGTRPTPDSTIMSATSPHGVSGKANSRRGIGQSVGKLAVLVCRSTCQRRASVRDTSPSSRPRVVNHRIGAVLGLAVEKAHRVGRSHVAGKRRRLAGHQLPGLQELQRVDRIFAEMWRPRRAIFSVRIERFMISTLTA